MRIRSHSEGRADWNLLIRSCCGCLCEDSLTHSRPVPAAGGRTGCAYAKTYVDRQTHDGALAKRFDTARSVCLDMRKSSDSHRYPSLSGRSVGSRVSRHAQDGGFQAVEVKRRRPALSVVAVVTAAVTAIVL